MKHTKKKNSSLYDVVFETMDFNEEQMLREIKEREETSRILRKFGEEMPPFDTRFD